MRRKLTIVVILLGLASFGWFYWTRDAASAPEVRTATVSRGPVVTTVTATGTTEAVMSVSVGSQVSGTIAWLGADFNSVVKKGQVIARLDPSLLQAQVEQARANLTKVNADLEQRLMSLKDKETKLARAERLNEQLLVSASDLGDARLSVDVAKTDLLAIRAQVSQAEAALNQAQVNLNHAAITAPIDGTVIDRSVDVGQTVAASLSSPTLFVIAADLADMRASLSVDESDVSKVVDGQPVTITVSAYPGERFHGTVSQVRLQPTVVSNVTTYTTIVDVANTERKLKPGMTATATIEIARRDDVLRVPNAALRFVPTDSVYAALGQAPAGTSAGATAATARAETTTAEGGARVVLASTRASARSADAGSQVSRATGQLWVFEDDQLRAVAVRTGISDGTYTEITEAPALAEGDAVVTNVSAGTETAAKTATASSVFTGAGAGRGMGPR